MDHPCQTCGAVVEDGRPFCPHCSAPQIHVPLAATGAAVAVEPVGHSLPVDDFNRPITLHAAKLGQADLGRAALKAGIVGGLVGMLSPLLGILLAGTFAVVFYRREKGVAPTVSIGARAAAAAGVIPYTLSYLFSVVRIFAFHHQQEYTEQFQKLWQSLGFNPSDPDIQAGIRFALTPSGTALAFLFGLIFAIALAAGAGALAALFSRRSRP